MTRLPCLGDILKQAGYRQVYLGGAPMEFAGKGKFLVDHGFDEVRGWEYWEDHGFKQRPDTWGLTDVELFDQAIQTIRDLRKTPPYNLTMLTIGTHLPGSLYQECSPYQGKKDTEPFIQAVHCTDALLGRFVGRLQSEGYLDKNTVLVITADHGVFRTRKMKELFGEMMYDKRLVTIIVGADFPWKTPMAAYDLAPSILSLLSIDHNADFILGTSVFKPNHRTDFFTSRYGDFVNGRYYDNNPARCSGLPNHGNLSLPFDSCGKKLLISSINMYHRQFSHPKIVSAQKTICENRIPFEVDLPGQDSSIMEVNLGGQSQGTLYSQQGWPIKSNRRGAYLLESDSYGNDVHRRFYDLKKRGQLYLLKDLQLLEKGRFVSLIFRLDKSITILPEVYRYLQKVSVKFADKSPKNSVLVGFTPLIPENTVTVQSRLSTPLSYKLNQRTCNDLITKQVIK